MPNTQTVMAALDSPTHREAKRPTQDGLIWPVPRPEMRSERRIRERMREDAQHLGPNCTTEDFHRLGWPRAHIAAHLPAVLAATTEAVAS